MADDLSDMKKAELIELAESLDLDASGTVKQLRARIEEAQAEQFGLEPEPEPAEEVEEVEAESPITTAILDGEDADSDHDFVRQAYLDILKRDADPAGLSGYVAALSVHGTLTRDALLEELKNSAEAKAL